MDSTQKILKSFLSFETENKEILILSDKYMKMLYKKAEPTSGMNITHG
jgi:hypothetical protein